MKITVLFITLWMLILVAGPCIGFAAGWGLRGKFDK